MEEIEDKKAKLKESKRKSYLKNKDKENDRSKNYYHSNKEELLRKQVEYRAKNKEKIAERKKEYRERNKEKEAQQRKEYRQKNKDAIQLRQAEYWAKNKEELSAKKRTNYDPKKRREEYERNKIKISTTSRKRYLKNKKEILFKHSKYRSENRHKAISYLYNRRYGIVLEEYEKMKLRQNNRCAICGVHADDTKLKKLCVDHDHQTGYVRSLLCHGCNTGIGLLKEKEEILLKAIEYLRKFKTNLDG